MPDPGTESLVEHYNGAWNAQDLDAVDDMHTDDVVFHNHTAGERVEGREAVRAHIGSIFERYPDMRFTTRGVRTAADFAANEWTAQATLPNGRRAEWEGVDIFAVREGRIARKDVYSSSATPRILS